MIRKNPEVIPYIVKITDWLNLILGVLVIILAVYTIADRTEHIFMVSNIMFCAAIINLASGVKRFFMEEYTKSLALAAVGIILMIISIIQKIIV